MIRHTTFGFHHDQSDERLYIEDGDRLIAYVDYSVYQGQPSIQMIKSSVSRKGYARNLILKLQSMFPETEIDWGMLTDEGAALHKSMVFKTVIDEPLKQKADLLAKIQAKIEALESNPPKNRDFALWNRLYDMERRLEGELENVSWSKKIIVG